MRSRLNSLNNLEQRIVAGIFGVVVIVGSILYSDVTFVLMFSLLSMLTQLEFYKLLGLDGNLPLTYYGTICGVALVVLTYVVGKRAHRLRELLPDQSIAGDDFFYKAI